MKGIGDFLARFQNLTPPDEAVKNAIAESVEEEIGLKVSKKDIYIKQNVAHVKASSVAKNTLALNRAKILERLYERLPKLKDSVRDIR